MKNKKLLQSFNRKLILTQSYLVKDHKKPNLLKKRKRAALLVELQPVAKLKQTTTDRQTQTWTVR